jgi:3-hydroxyisobutyrate dehydrogenase-like beta-hydroxyacid dehydrogenase
MSALVNKGVAVFGLGTIGSRACVRLYEAGWEVACWSRTRRGLQGEMDSAGDAVAGARFLSIYLKDAPAVMDLMERIEPFLRPGQLLLNHATLDLETTLWLAERCAALGCGFLDAPFTGSKLAAQTGKLYYYLGGDLELIAHVESYLAVTSRGYLHCGDVGTATVVKLTTNLISACTVQAMAESLAIATHNGVTAECLMQAVEENACASLLTSMKFPAMVEGVYEPHFSLANMAKDSRYMLALAEGIETPALTAVSQRMEQLTHDGLGEFDFSVVAKPYLQLDE